jgi:predicted MFS family arabinose efflux permease
MLRQRNIALCAAISCMLVGSAVLCAIFLPLYLVTVRHFSPAQMATIMALLGLCPPAGGVLLPWISDRIGRRPPMIVAGALMTLTPIAALWFAGPSSLLVALMLLGWIGMGAFPLFMAVVPAETLHFRHTAAAMGLIVAIGELTGGVAAPLLAGGIADAFGLGAPLIVSAAMSAAAIFIALALRETNPKTIGATPA